MNCRSELTCDECSNNESWNVRPSFRAESGEGGQRDADALGVGEPAQRVSRDRYRALR
jgi:hypothetical protein